MNINLGRQLHLNTVSQLGVFNQVENWKIKKLELRFQVRLNLYINSDRFVYIFKGFCKSGSHSPTGLEPCIACEKGYYQDMEGQKACSKCGVNETTSSVGSNSSKKCGSM